MNRSTVLHVLGLLLLFLAAAMLVPIPFLALLCGRHRVGFLGVGCASPRCGRLSVRPLSQSPTATCACKTALPSSPSAGWPCSLFGCAALSAARRSIPNPIDALFETISGFTTTGATILVDIEVLPPGILLWRDFTHWLGGMGIIVLSVAILPFLGVGGMQLFRAESPGPMADRLTPRITQTAKILWGVYVLISAVQVVLLLLGGMSLLQRAWRTPLAPWAPAVSRR